MRTYVENGQISSLFHLATLIVGIGKSLEVEFGVRMRTVNYPKHNSIFPTATAVTEITYRIFPQGCHMKTIIGSEK